MYTYKRKIEKIIFKINNYIYVIIINKIIVVNIKYRY